LPAGGVEGDGEFAFCFGVEALEEDGGDVFEAELFGYEESVSAVDEGGVFADDDGLADAVAADGFA
jgi:hypothetical protein